MKCSTVTILEGGEFLSGFCTECGGINQGGAPRVPKAPRLIPTHKVGKPYKHKHGGKYWHYFLRMGNHPKV